MDTSTYEGDLSRQQFRDGMSRLGAAVNVITSDGPAGKLGFTASAVCSVSDTPPTLLLCMNRSSLQNVPLKQNGVFCVNSLSGHQQHLADTFAGVGALSIPERFEKAEWTTLATGAPILRNAVVSFDCRIKEVSEVGTHSIIIASVLAVGLCSSAAHGLIYFGRRYHALSEAPAVALK
ncbi:flavin reductase [Pandoraea sp. ISTKB]|uniref:flavin reductase n=1 Tax=Pandoraea sp. ISTKB TaxID=1586708 RepID=UPI000847C4F4|nr:flavin reductase [Pandoraea sp. ISTKB]ODP34399.1 hypothetical protein A9762_15630 [Pandoraea sp. ISTKB]